MVLTWFEVDWSSLTKIFHRFTWNINGPVSVELHGGSMVSPTKNPWEYTWICMGIPWGLHGQFHGFTMDILEQTMVLYQL